MPKVRSVTNFQLNHLGFLMDTSILFRIERLKLLINRVICILFQKFKNLLNWNPIIIRILSFKNFFFCEDFFSICWMRADRNHCNSLKKCKKISVSQVSIHFKRSWNNWRVIDCWHCINNSLSRWIIGIISWILIFGFWISDISIPGKSRLYKTKLHNLIPIIDFKNIVLALIISNYPPLLIVAPLKKKVSITSNNCRPLIIPTIL